MTTPRDQLPLHQRYALRPCEAPAYLGVKETFFRERVLPYVPVRHMGGVKVIRRVDLERFVDQLPTTIGNEQ